MRPRVAPGMLALAAVSVATLLLPTAGAGALGVYGAPASHATAGIIGIVTAIGAADIGFLDNNPADGSIGLNEAIILSIAGGATVAQNDILLNNPASSGLTGAVGSAISSAPSGVLDDDDASGELVNKLRFIDTLPLYANGGPDGQYNAGEGLFLDLDNTLSPTTNDVVLSAGTGLSGSPGSRVSSTQSESVWDDFNECVYASTDATSSTGDTLLSADNGANCPTLGAPLVSITGIRLSSITRSVSDMATTSASTTVTSATAAFVAGDVGFSVTGTNIPTGTRIASITNGQTAVLTNAASATGAALALTIGDATVLDTGEEAYFAAGSTVASGDYRLTTTAGGAQGTIVRCGVWGSDTDCANPLAGAAGSTLVTQGSRAFGVPVIGYADSNGNAIYDGVDKVLLDRAVLGFVSPSDVFLSTASSTTFGANPTLSGNPEVGAVITPTFAAATFEWLDSGTNPGQVDSAEPIALHFAAANADLSPGDLCITAVGGCAAGAQLLAGHTQPSLGTTWAAVSGATNPGNLGYVDANNNNKYDLGDQLFLHFGAVPGNVAAGDVQISGDTSTSGARVTSAGGALLVPPTLYYRYYDADSSSSYSIGDIPYIDRSNVGTLVANPGDVRLGSVAGLTGLINVKDADTDAVNTLLSPTATGTRFSYRDLDGSSALSLNDPIFFMPRATNCPLVGSDVVLSPGTLSGATAGAFVGALSNSCTDIAGSTFVYTPAGQFSKDSVVYVDIDGDTTIETNNVRLTGSAAGASGSRVGGASTTDLNTAATALTLGAPLAPRAGNVAITYADASGDEVAAGGETVILDVDGNGLFTVGDVPLSGTGTSGSSGGGGGGTTVVTTTSSTSSSSSSSSSSSTSSTSSSGSTTDSGTDNPLSLASINLALQASLEVDREDGQNVLTWDAQAGVTGYQVFSADSPFVLIATLDSQSTDTYTDPNGDADTQYLVTAYQGTPLTADDVNNGDVPGYSGIPEGKDADGSAGGKGWIPGPGLALMVLALAAAVLVARRKL